MTRLFVPSERRTLADELRKLLDDSESRAVALRSASPQEARELLAWLDRIYDLIPELQAGGASLEAELGRWEAVQGSVRRYAGALRQAVRSQGGYPALRRHLSPPPERKRWWWWLDEIAAQNRRRQVRIAAAAVAAGVVALVAIVWTLSRLFPVDPAVATVYRLRSQAEGYVQEGQFFDAIANLEAARHMFPEDRDTLIWLAALYITMGEEEEADPLLSDLYARFPAPTVNTGLANVYSLVGRSEQALALALDAAADAPDDPQTFLAVATAYERMRQYEQAIAYYSRAAEVAERAGHHEIVVVARMQMGMLMQALPALDRETPLPVNSNQ